MPTPTPLRVKGDPHLYGENVLRIPIPAGTIRLKPKPKQPLTADQMRAAAEALQAGGLDAQADALFAKARKAKRREVDAEADELIRKMRQEREDGE